MFKSLLNYLVESFLAILIITIMVLGWTMLFWLGPFLYIEFVFPYTLEGKWEY